MTWRQISDRPVARRVLYTHVTTPIIETSGEQYLTGPTAHDDRCPRTSDSIFAST